MHDATLLFIVVIAALTFDFTNGSTAAMVVSSLMAQTHRSPVVNSYDNKRRQEGAGRAQRVCGKPRSTFEVAGSGQREVTTLPRV